MVRNDIVDLEKIANITDLNYTNRYKPLGSSLGDNLKTSVFMGGSKKNTNINVIIKNLYISYSSGNKSIIKIKTKLFEQKKPSVSSKKRGGQKLTLSSLTEIQDIRNLNYNRPYSGHFPVHESKYPQSSLA